MTSAPKHEASVRTRWQRAIGDSDYPAEVKLIGWALGSRMDPDGACWPSLTTIAKDASRDRAQVKRHLRTLRTGGWLTIIKGGGRGLVNRYQAVIPAHPRARLARKGAHTETERGAYVDVNGRAHAPQKLNYEVSIEESKESASNRLRRSPVDDDLPDTDFKSQPLTEEARKEQTVG